MRHVFATSFKAVNNLMGESVTYQGQTLKAIRGKTVFRETAVDGGGRVTRSTDFLFAIADIDLPTEGELIVASDRTFRVSSVNGEPCYRLEPTGSTVRVHTLEWADNE